MIVVGDEDSVSHAGYSNALVVLRWDVFQMVFPPVYRVDDNQSERGRETRLDERKL